MKRSKIAQEWDLVYYLTSSQLEAESSRTYAGYLWWVLDPLIGVGIYYLLFKVIFNRGGEDFIEFLFLGLITWKWFAGSLSQSSESIQSKKGLIKKMPIKKWIFPVTALLYQTWKFLVIFAVGVGFYLFRYGIHLELIFLPLVILSQFVLILGLGFLFSGIIPFFPDFGFFIQYSLRLLIYPSGVVFNLALVPEKYQFWLSLNPIAGLIQSYREILMYGRGPNWLGLGLSLTVGIVSGFIGLKILKKYDKIYPKLL